MTTTISSFTHSAELAQQWVNELARNLDCSEARAYRLLRSVLHVARDWLPREEMAGLSAQLPLLLRGVYFEGWDPSGSPVLDRGKSDFIERIQHELGDERMNDPEVAVTAVFRLFDRHLSPGEATQIRHSMRKSLQRLWPTG